MLERRPVCRGSVKFPRKVNRIICAQDCAFVNSTFTSQHIVIADDKDMFDSYEPHFESLLNAEIYTAVLRIIPICVFDIV